MKKIFIGLVSLSLFGFIGCTDLFDFFFGEDGGSETPAYGTVTATDTIPYNYDSSYPIFEVAPTTKSVTISGVPSGKSVYIAKVNTGKSTVARKHTRTVGEDSSTGYRAALASEFQSLDDIQIPESQFKHFHAPAISLKEVQNSARVSSSSTESFDKKNLISRTVGATKQIYVDKDVKLSSYISKQATLRAKGTYCNVWVVDDYYTSGDANGSKVNSSIAKSFADKFDSFYPVVRNIFGNECNNLIYSYSSATTLKAASSSYPMGTYGENGNKNVSGYSDTGTIVNIVLYDIGNDSTLSESQQCGVLGYFYAKDYYSRITNTSSDIKYSNEGKYFYVDSAYSVSNFETVISTLAHEFQHMVNFGVKNVDRGVDSPKSGESNIANKVDTAYNEMLSMLCEDMMSDFLGLDSTNNVQAERLPYFNTTYFISGIREYLSTYSSLSYSTSYGFGSWLCRQYGGADLVKEIMANNYGGNQSLVAAVNALNGTNFTFDQLFQQFLIACTNEDGNGPYTHLKNAAKTAQYPETGTATYKYPMDAINLWASDYKYPQEKNPFLVQNQQQAAYGYDESLKDAWKTFFSANQKTDAPQTWSGPFLFGNGYGSDLRPLYGITLHKLGTTNSSTLSLTFSDTGADCVTMYVIIQ